jgi:L-ribulose-5-phosphate 3-epimerase
MIKCINAWAFSSDRQVSNILQIAKDQGFQAVELTVAEGGPLPLTIDEEGCRRISDEADKLGRKISSVASGLGWSLPATSDDPETRRKGVEAVKQKMRIANWLRTDAVLMVPGGVYASFAPGVGRVPYEVAHERARDALLELAPLAEELGVRIGVENVWNMMLLSPLEMRDFLDDIGSEFIGSYFDAGNVILTGFPEDWIHILGSRIKRVHIKDFKRSVGNLDGFCDLLEGDVDFPAVMAALRETGYNGYVTAEYFDCENKLPQISAAMDRILEM